ncbi:MAG TPA: hypothetical protein V6D27_00615 [Vampirovibrionales bacterium]
MNSDPLTYEGEMPRCPEHQPFLNQSNESLERDKLDKQGQDNSDFTAALNPRQKHFFDPTIRRIAEFCQGLERESEAIEPPEHLENRRVTLVTQTFSKG